MSRRVIANPQARKVNRGIESAIEMFKPDNISFRWSNKLDSSCLFPDIVLGDFANAITERPFDSIFQDRGEIELLKWRNFCGQNYGLPEFFLLKVGDNVERSSISSSFDTWQFGATLYKLITRIILDNAFAESG